MIRFDTFIRFHSKSLFFRIPKLAVATAAIPLADSIGFAAFLAARALQGVAFASTFPVTGLIMHDWAPLKGYLFLI
jgi:MFS family permease